MRFSLALVFLLGVSRAAAAHPAPFSFLDLAIRDDGVHGTLVLHVVDVAHDLGIEPAERLLGRAELAGLYSRMTALLAPRMRISADGTGQVQWLELEPAPDRHAVQIRFRIPAARPGTVRLHAHLFPYDAVHQTFINIYEDNNLRQQLILNDRSTEYVFYTGSRQGTLAVMRTFIPAGIQHILIGPDHVLFLVGLLLLGGSWLALVRIVTAFTVGHSLTLSLAALNLVLPPPRLIEPAIALSIVFVGADNLVRGSGRDVRAWVALVFGLVHGFGFANVLREFGLPQGALGWSLFSFNLGVEIGQLAIVVLVTTALETIRRRDRVLGSRIAWAGSVIVIAAGTYWFVQRVI